ncbi:DUF6383 domain-containing protein [Parabacteroides sp.]
MNKRISTLMAMGLLTVGSLIGTANAQTNQAGAGTVFKGDVYYYLGSYTAEDGYHYISGTVGVKDKFTSLGSEMAATPDEVRGQEAYLWAISSVTRNGVPYFTFKNKETGTLLTFTKDGNVAVKADEAVANEFAWLDANKYTTDGKVASLASKKLAYGDESWSLADGEGSKIAVYTQDSQDVTAKDLNDALGNGFALSFPNANPQPKENVFDQKIRAWNLVDTEVEAEAVDGAVYVEGVPAGTYFTVSTPVAGIVDQETFNASTFIAVDPATHYGINKLPRTAGVGFAFKVVSGESLITTETTTKEQVYVGNANFTVSEMDNVNKPDQYTLMLNKVYVKKDASKDDQAKITTVYVDAITSTGTTYVTTTNEPTSAKCTISTSNMVKASELLKQDGPSVFNLMFLSNKDKVTNVSGNGTSSEYGKYLGLKVNSSNSYEMFAQAPDYVDLNAPQNQWVVTEVDGQKFVFSNRENSALTFTASLRKTDNASVYEANFSTSGSFAYGYVKDGKYRTDGSAAWGALTVQLTPATVTPSAGYVDYSDAELAELARLKFTVGSDVLYKELYLKAENKDNGKVAATQNTSEAAEWEVIKFDGSAAASDVAKSDTIYGTTKYAYIVKNEETKTDGEIKDIAIVSYAFKLHVDGVNYYLTVNSNNYTVAKAASDNVKNAPRFIVKENKNGSAYLISAGTNRKYSDIIKATTNGLGLNTTTGELSSENIYKIPTPKNARFYVVRDVATPSLPSIARHASFEALTGGFVAVGEANDAVIAPTSEDAENLTFWLDTTNTKAYTPAFYISKGVDTTANAPRMFLYNAKDSASYYNPGSASQVTDNNYKLVDGSIKAIFRPATLTGIDTLSTVVAAKETELTAKNGLNNFKYQIILKDADVEGKYIIKSVSNANYIFNLNGKLGFTNDKSKALVVTVKDGIIPTGNESIDNATSSIVVIGNAGSVTIQGAQGETAYVRNLLGMPLAETVVTSDNATIAVPAGIVLVTVGEETVKVVVK